MNRIIWEMFVVRKLKNVIVPGYVQVTSHMYKNIINLCLQPKDNELKFVGTVDGIKYEFNELVSNILVITNPTRKRIIDNEEKEEISFPINLTLSYNNDIFKVPISFYSKKLKGFFLEKIKRDKTILSKIPICENNCAFFKKFDIVYQASRSIVE